jgi:hypothetical protein
MRFLLSTFQLRRFVRTRDKEMAHSVESTAVDEYIEKVAI